MKIFYGSGNILVTSQMGGGAASQILGFIDALQKEGHSVKIDISGEENIYPKIRTKPWLAWVRKNIPISWLAYEILQIINNRKIRQRLLQKDLTSFDLVWQRYELFTTAYAEIAHQHKVPNVLFVDAPLITERQEYSHLWLKDYSIRAIKRNVQLADLVVTVSSVIADYIREYVESPQLPIHVMPNGFADHILTSTHQSIDNIRQEYFNGFNGKVIGFVGAPLLWHRLEYLIQAANELWKTRQDFRVLIVGEGPDSPRQLQLVKELKLQEVIKFTGIIPFKEIGPFIHLLNIGVMPDSNTYGSPMKIAEYMACGAVPVAPDLKPIADFCTNEVDSLLFPKDDVQALTWQIGRLLDSNELLDMLSKNAQKKALNNFSWKARIQTLQHLLQSIQKSNQ